MASIENEGTCNPAYSNQNCPGSSNMSRPIGASSSSPMARDDTEPTIPEPKTPPQTPAEKRRARSRSPLPRNRMMTQAQDAGDGVCKILVRTQDTAEEIYMHESQPLAMVKVMIAIPDPTQCVRLEYKHAPLASHTTIGSLPKDAWLFASYRTSNSFGDGTHWTLHRDAVRAAARLPFRAPCESYPGPLTQERMEQWARPRKAVDALVILPCGRVGTVDFGGEERPLEWLQQVLFQKFGGQFMSQPPRLMSLCGCKRHWSQLLEGEDGHDFHRPPRGFWKGNRYDSGTSPSGQCGTVGAAHAEANAATTPAAAFRGKGAGDGVWAQAETGGKSLRFKWADASAEVYVPDPSYGAGQGAAPPGCP